MPLVKTCKGGRPDARMPCGDPAVELLEIKSPHRPRRSGQAPDGSWSLLGIHPDGGAARAIAQFETVVEMAIPRLLIGHACNRGTHVSTHQR